MNLFICTAAILAVTVIYFFWRSYDEGRRRQQRALRERVAFMLWLAADMADGEDPFDASRQDYLTTPSA